MSLNTSPNVGSGDEPPSHVSVKNLAWLEHSPHLTTDLAVAVELQRCAESHDDPLVLATRTWRVWLAVTPAVWAGARVEVELDVGSIGWIHALSGIP